MSTKTASKSNIASKSNLTENKHNWTRPIDWTPMPVIADNENKIAILVPVTPSNYSTVGSQFMSFGCNVSSGSYYVDWGDGTNNTYSGGTVAQHEYFPNNITSAVTSRGYKTALIVVTPVTSGASFTSFELGTPTSNVPTISNSIFLDVIANTTNTNATISPNNNFRPAIMCERIIWNDKFRIPAASTCFSEMKSLEVLPAKIKFSLSPQNAYGLFINCHSLEYIPELVDLNIATGAPTISFSSAFAQCYRLKEIPYINIPSGITCNNIFSNCFEITYLPALNINPTGTAASCFSNCYKLKDVSRATFNFTNTTDLSNFFSGCYQLENFPSFASITSTCTTLNAAFQECRKMAVIPTIGNTSGVTNMSSMFSGCISITKANDLGINPIACNTFANMFQNCLSLQEVMYPFTGSFKTIPTGTSAFSATFSGCLNLKRITLGQTLPTNQTIFGFPSYGHLSEVEIAGINFTTTVANNCLSGPVLNNIYTNLASGVSAKTITVTGNFGTATDTPAIATAKGWTVTG